MKKAIYIFLYIHLNGHPRDKNGYEFVEKKERIWNIFEGEAYRTAIMSY